jgi:hypothetical protein
MEYCCKWYYAQITSLIKIQSYHYLHLLTYYAVNIISYLHVYLWVLILYHQEAFVYSLCNNWTLFSACYAPYVLWEIHV